MKVALIQINSGNNKSANIKNTLIKIQTAIDKGAQFILLPEIFNYRGKLKGVDLFNEIAEEIPGDSIVPLLDIAKKEKVNILAGSIYERSSKNNKIYNTSLMIDAAGSIICKYRKIHLFHAIINGVEIDESDIYAAGNEPVICNVNNIKVGMSICYDLRFPEHYRNYFNKGVDVIVVPSSFTLRTGELHWETLLRARAIENYSYVLAPNQCGLDGNAVQTYGHSMGIDPQGNIIGILKNMDEGILYIEIGKVSSMPKLKV